MHHGRPMIGERGTHIMTERGDDGVMDRRGFLKTAGAGLTAAGAVAISPDRVAAQALSEKHRLDRIATNSWALRQLFKSRPGGGRGRGTAPAGTAAPAAGGGAPSGRGGGTGRAGTGGQTAAQMKQKYGEITMMDFPQFTKDTFPGVTHLDIRSSLMGDVTDDSMYVRGLFDPSSASGRKWLEGFDKKLAATGTKVQHISNNAPTNLADPMRSATSRRRNWQEMAGRRRDSWRAIGADELSERLRREHPSVRRQRSGHGLSEKRCAHAAS